MRGCIARLALTTAWFGRLDSFLILAHPLAIYIIYSTLRLLFIAFVGFTAELFRAFLGWFLKLRGPFKGYGMCSY